MIVARVEALIAGRGLDEALRRAEAYTRAGADAILIHSARADANEVLAFKQAWGDRAPVVIVPTKYYATPTRVFRDAGFSVVIWANHLPRPSLAAMQETARELFARQSLVEIEGRVASFRYNSIIAGFTAMAAYAIVPYVMRTGAPVSYVGATREISVVFGTVVGVVFLKEQGTVTRVFGSSLIAAGVGAIALLG